MTDYVVDIEQLGNPYIRGAQQEIALKDKMIYFSFGTDYIPLSG